MKSKIKQITLLDGKQIFYPSEEELLKLQSNIKSLIIEEEMTTDEFHKYYHCVECLKARCTAI